MPATSTYFDALLTFVLNRYAEAKLIDHGDHETTTLALRTYLNTISHGLPDTTPEDKPKVKSTNFFRRMTTPKPNPTITFSKNLEEFMNLDPSSLHYSENAGRKPQWRQRSPYYSSALISKAYPCPKCRPPTPTQAPSQTWPSRSMQLT
ncbi:hypothetical protein QBC36DRAFT_288086 [Triangularia setosa]|uniref:Uncharacterized protein n=1 Tax=Triangularia setosa TaxID=2587417 RepID=A0AAN6WD76_9PEZI|nr:hypothetical protein QBC36DRAFT_288086 [Podospora setosa]